MLVYKFTFANNAVISCTEAKGKTLDSESYYEHHNGLLIYAFVQAEDEKQARSVAEGVINRFIAGECK